MLVIIFMLMELRGMMIRRRRRRRRRRMMMVMMRMMIRMGRMRALITIIQCTCETVTL